MLSFLLDWLVAIGSLLGFGLAGLGVAVPLAANHQRILGTSPLIGALLVPFGANAIYSILGLSYSASAMLSVGGCVALGLANCRGLKVANLFRPTLLIVVIGTVAIFICDAATLHTGGPSILYTDGTDHAGYAQVADWLLGHTIHQPPRASPNYPNESWPAYMLAVDPRFGTYGLLAIFSALRRTSSLFAYDLTVAVVMAAGVVAVASAYARSVPGLLLLVVGLFSSHWYDYGQAGYLGKLVAYPSALLLVSCAFRAAENPSIRRIFSLLLLASSIGVAHSGTATAVLVMPMLAAAWIAGWCGHRDNIATGWMVYGIAALAPIIASGISARPLAGGIPDYGLQWSYILPRILDLENQGVAISGASKDGLLAMLALSVMAWAAIVVLAIKKGNVTAVGLLVGPMLLLTAFLTLDARPVAFQTIGFIYPAILCGGCTLLEDVSGASRRTVFVILLVLVGMRVPRTLGALDRYALNPDARSIFTAREIATLATRIGSASAMIDITQPQSALVLLTELGRRHLNLQWSEAGWKAILGYREWPWPGIGPRPNMGIVPSVGRGHFAVKLMN